MSVISERHCPSCGASLAEKAVLCIQCGYHLERGLHLANAFGPATTPAVDRSNPYRSPNSVEADRAAAGGILSELWIAGRISRRKWWAYWICCNAILVLLGGLLEAQLVPKWVAVVTFWPAMWLLFVAQVKRWHDMDKSGFWCLVNVIPCVGPLYAIIELGLQRGTAGENSYGPDPLPPRSDSESNTSWLN